MQGIHTQHLAETLQHLKLILLGGCTQQLWHLAQLLAFRLTELRQKAEGAEGLDLAVEPAHTTHTKGHVLFGRVIVGAMPVSIRNQHAFARFLLVTLELTCGSGLNLRLDQAFFGHALQGSDGGTAVEVPSLGAS